MQRAFRFVSELEQLRNKALAASRDIVGYAPLTLPVPHAVSLILLEQKSSHLSAAHYLRYHTCLLNMPNVTVKRCTTLNPASLMPTPGEGEPHDCLAELQHTCTPRPDLSDIPLQNPDAILYVDGSASCCPETGQGQVGFAVVSDTATLIAKSLPKHLSAQAAELIALTEACKLAEGSSVTIYTDSRYAFGVVHDFGALWKHRNFLKSDGKPILHRHLINDLLTAILLPSQVAICKCSAHTGAADSVSRGNARADAAAKTAARLPLSHVDTLVTDTQDLEHFSLPESVAAMQTHAAPQERQQWKTAGCTFNWGCMIPRDHTNLTHRCRESISPCLQCY